MNKRLLSALVIILSFSSLGGVIFAQEAPGISINPLTESTNSGQVPSNQKPTLTSQKVVSSTLSCIKVGSPPEDQKASVCKEVFTSQQDTFGPILGGGVPTLENCGEDPLGQILMCYKPASVFYCQGDPRWGNICNMSQAGCGPTTMAMVFSAYGDTITPPDMDKVFQQKGYRSCGDNPSLMQSAIQTLLPENGYEYHALGAPLNLNRAQEYLNAGYLIIGSTFGHIFIIDGVDAANNTLRMRDPGRCENKDGVVRSADAPWGGQPLYYSYAVKKRAK